jgi:acyl-CoA reductase-like NAD-dependent aldehyde dehydrogenase
VGAIGPWNWPMMITLRQIAPALRMGNTVVVKPSQYTPLSVLALVEVINSVLGGVPDPDAAGYFYPITLVADVDDDNPLVAEEQFGPALPIVRSDDLDEAVAMANALDVGLGASVWSSDREAARAVAARLEAGTVWINSHGGVHPMIPFSGVKKVRIRAGVRVEGLQSVAAPQVITG